MGICWFECKGINQYWACCSYSQWNIALESRSINCCETYASILLESGHLSILAWNRMLLICRVRLSLSMMLVLVSCDNSASTQPPLSPASTSLHPPLTSSCHGEPEAGPAWLSPDWRPRPPTTLTDITHKQDNTPTPGQNFYTNQVNNNMGSREGNGMKDLCNCLPQSFCEGETTGEKFRY